MYWFKNLIKSKNKPYFDNSANEIFNQFYTLPENDSEIILRVVREIRYKGRDVCSIDSNLTYTYQFKNGKYKKVDLKKTGRRKSAKKLFDRMASNIDEIRTFNSDLRPISDDNIILITYVTNTGIYQDIYTIDRFPDKGISAHVFSTFWNYVDLIDKNRQKRIQKMMSKQTSHV
ncbi:hypothetical protein [Flagellimonas sp.]|uniref:hypothetical protein n=1 Tax=Flagellimonas sp. TaxID=2058762 RepID=UPI003B50231D